ncbi:NAD(P)-binding protein [Saccharata proteae CBS 121410]|uniref:NAD(P)-binding protein n=1 Tax=Saccharata proteae CBS 121410 TaxID=1314787 RepID=A0A9P4HYS2_9PEZI|nr:NAD(P)-binding protein [Saccharata proteae CBS 121410]
MTEPCFGCVRLSGRETITLPAGIDYSKIPAGTPPAGTVSNLVDPPNLKNTLLVVNIVFTVLMGVMVSVRLVVKGLIAKVLWWDDCERGLWCVGGLTDLLTLIRCLHRCGCMFSASNIVYITAIFMAKVSMLLLYLRMFPRDTRLGKWIIGMISFLAIFWAAFLGVGIASEFKCVTIADSGSDFCTEVSTNLIIVQSSITVATDYYILLLPVIPFFKLLVQSRQKVLIVVIFLTGLLACAASTTRLALFCHDLGTSDNFWVQANTTIYAIVEINAAIISGCVLNMPAFFSYSKGLALRAYKSATSLVSRDGGSSAMSARSPTQYEQFDSVLVTGGCGFIGHHIVAALLSQQPTCKITVLDIAISNPLPAVSYHKVDIADETALRKVLTSLEYAPRVVIHTACSPILGPSADLFWRVNVNGARNVLSACQSLGSVRAFIHLSSSSVIHDNRTDLVEADETWPVLTSPKVQKRIYSLTKAHAETEILAAAADRKGGMPILILRPTTVFGPGNDLFINKLINLAETGRAKYQLGDGKNDWDFCYIDNFIHAVFLASTALLRASASPPLPPSDPNRVEAEVFNITNFERLSFWGFQLAVADAIGKPVPERDLWKIPLWAGVCMGFVAEWSVWLLSLGRKESNMTAETVKYTYLVRTLKCEKARERLGYRPLVGLREGIQRTVDWHLEQAEKKKV